MGLLGYEHRWPIDPHVVTRETMGTWVVRLYLGWWTPPIGDLVDLCPLVWRARSARVLLQMAALNAQAGDWRAAGMAVARATLVMVGG